MSWLRRAKMHLRGSRSLEDRGPAAARHRKDITNVARALPNWQRKIIVDMTNAYGAPTKGLGGQPFRHSRRGGVRGSRLVKGFNPLVAVVLKRNPTVHGGRRVVFLASDDDDAAAQVGALAEKPGFAPVNLGGLSAGGLLAPTPGKSWGRLIFEDLIKFD